MLQKCTYRHRNWFLIEALSLIFGYENARHKLLDGLRHNDGGQCFNWLFFLLLFLDPLFLFFQVIFLSLIQRNEKIQSTVHSPVVVGSRNGN